MKGLSVKDFLDQTITMFESPKKGTGAADDEIFRTNSLGNLRLLRGKLLEALGEDKISKPTKITEKDNVTMVVNDFLEGRATIDSSKQRIEELLD